MSRKYTIEEVSEEFERGGCTLLADTYVNNKHRLSYICECGNESRISLVDFRRGSRCKKCAAQKTASKKRHSFEYVFKAFEENGCALLSDKYVNNSDKLDYICICGRKSSINFANFNQGQRCKKCATEKIVSQQRHSYEYIEKAFTDNNCILLSKEYVNVDAPLHYICKCGNESVSSFTTFRDSGCCKKCSYEKTASKQRHSFEFVKKIFNEQGCKLISVEYVNLDGLLDYECVCGEKSSISFNNFRSGHRCMKCGLEKTSGENNGNYNPNLTDEERIIRRKYPEYTEWRMSVYERDSFTCQCCGDNNHDLNAHHLDGYNWCIERRTDVSNGVTLCESCHTDFHLTYGYGDNTEAQYNEWLRNKNTLEREAQAI